MSEQHSKLVVFAVLAGIFPASSFAADTVQSLLEDGTSYVESAARIMVYVAAAFGIILSANSIYQLAMHPEHEPNRWKHVASLVVGSLFTIFGVIVGFFSNFGG